MAVTPTLLVFTLDAEAARRRRRLLPGSLRRGEVALRRACLGAALTAGREAGCRLRVASPRPMEIAADVEAIPQRGASFGARLDAALSRAFEGGGPVVVVGSDVPGLSARHVRRALELLQASPGRVVVGPSPDGGFYLLAASRPVEGLTDGVRWCSAGTRASLLAALAAAGREAVLLEPLADLDGPADVERWLRRPGRRPELWRSLVALLRRLLATVRRPLEDVAADIPRAAAVAAIPARSPPSPAPA